MSPRLGTSNFHESQRILKNIFKSLCLFLEKSKLTKSAPKCQHSSWRLPPFHCFLRFRILKPKAKTAEQNCNNDFGKFMRTIKEGWVDAKGLWCNDGLLCLCYEVEGNVWKMRTEIKSSNMIYWTIFEGMMLFEKWMLSWLLWLWLIYFLSSLYLIDLVWFFLFVIISF